MYTYVGRDGTQVSFTKYPANQSAYNVYGNEAYATSLVRPSGESLTLTYELRLVCDYYDGDFCEGGFKQVRRVAAVKSAFGYMASYSYQSDDPDIDLIGWMAQADIKLVNLSQEYCDSFVAGCSTSQTWPSLSNPNAPRMTYTESGGVVTGVRRPGSSSDDIAIAYTGGKVSSITDRAGTTTYDYAPDSGGSRTVTVTDGMGVVTIYVFNIASERLTSVTNGAGQTTGYQYDGNGRLTRTTLPEGDYTQLTYDARGNVTATTQVAKPGSGLAAITTSAVYPSTCANPVTCNRPTSTTAARGKVTDYTWDAAHGGLLTVTGPAPAAGQPRPQVRYTYTALQAQVKTSTGRIAGTGTNVVLPASVSSCATLTTCTGTADETVQTITYAATGVANNLLPTSQTVKAGDNSVTRTSGLAWDAIGNLTAVDGPLAGAADTTTLRYDWLRRKVGVVSADPDGAGTLTRLAQRFTYGTNNLLTKVENGNVADAGDTAWAAFTTNDFTDYTYDGNGRTLTETAKSGATSYSLTQYSYDAAGRPLCMALRMNTAAYASLPASACTLGTAGSAGPDRIGKMMYDAAGRPLRRLVAVGTADEADAVEVDYTASGQVAWAEDGASNRTTYTYDGFDRVVKAALPVLSVGLGISSSTDYEAYTYDAGGNVLTRRTRRGETLSYSYDALNRMTLKTVPERTGLASTYTRDVYYGYDLHGLQTYARFDSAAGEGVTTAWDALGQPTATTLTMDGTARTLAYLYDAAGSRTRVTHPDAAWLGYQYDVLGRMTRLDSSGTTGLVTQTFNAYGLPATLARYGSAHDAAFGYSPIGLLTSMGLTSGTSSANVSWTFTRNPAGQLASETRDNDIYAWTGSVNVDRAYTANGLNQYTAAGPATFTYDANGNLAADGTSTYVYDVENRLVGKTTGAATTALRYDPLGRLYEVVDPASGTTRFLHDGDALAGEYNASGTMLARYGHGALAGVDDPLVSYAGSAITTANARFLYADPRGSIVLAANSSGTATATNAYDEYGIPGSVNAGRFQYTGQAWLPELRLYYYKARMYSPTLGRFMQTDPIGYADNANLYAYVGNDPVNWVDPSGLASDLPKICPRAREQIQVCASLSDPLARLAQAAAGMHPTIPSAAFLRHYRAPPKPQSDFRVDQGTPPNSKRCEAGGISFRAPNDFSPPDIVRAGYNGGLLGVNSNVGHYGTYDFQRVRTSSGGTIFYSQYTPVANMAVGFYLIGAGHPRAAANLISDAFASAFSSNGATAQQDKFRNLAYDVADGEAKIVCYPGQ